jgi:hypothetical protein
VKLHYLPSVGEGYVSDRVGYRVHDTTRIRGVVVVLGRESVDGRETNWFVAVYDHEGHRVPGSGSRSTPSVEQARDVYDAYVNGRRRAA